MAPQDAAKANPWFCWSVACGSQRSWINVIFLLELQSQIKYEGNIKWEDEHKYKDDFKYKDNLNYTKPNKLNQTKPTKPYLQNQTYQTKPNLSSQN